MHYIFDVLINLKKEIYDIYDWNRKDSIVNLRKVPIIKVSEKQFFDLFTNVVQIEESFLEKIYNKADAFQKFHYQVLEYVCVITDGKKAFVSEFKDQKNEYISLMLFDEEEEVLDIARSMEEINLSYQVLMKRNSSLKTRKEIQKISFVQNELSKITDDKLMYLYLECFNKSSGEKKQMKIDIQNQLDDRVFLNKVYDFFKLTSKKTKSQ